MSGKRNLVRRVFELQGFSRKVFEKIVFLENLCQVLHNELFSWYEDWEEVEKYFVKMLDFVNDKKEVSCYRN